MFQKTKLKNNLTLLTSPMPGVQSATVMAGVKAGSRYETKKISGISHFLEHMAFKGTKKRPSAKHIAAEIDAVGGEFNAFTSKDHTVFFIKAGKKHIPLMLDILSDMLTNSLFKEEEIEREKGVIVEEINMYEDTPMRKVGEVFENLMFGDCPMGWDIAGKADIIRAIKREDFLKYIDGLYKAGNMAVAVAGGMSGANRQLTDLVQRYFKGVRDEKTVSFEKFKQLQNKPRLRIVHKKTEQAHLVLGFPSIDINDERKYALSVLTTILGGGMSSRLFTEVRERRGLAYYVHAANDSYFDCGSWTVSAGVDLKRIDEAVKVIQNEIYKTISRGPKTEDREISESELHKAKEYLKGHFILSLEDSQAVAGLYASQFLLEKKVETPEEILAAIEAVGMDEVYSVAKAIFKPRLTNLAVIGPFEEPSRFEKLIN